MTAVDGDQWVADLATLLLAERRTRLRAVEAARRSPSDLTAELLLTPAARALLFMHADPNHLRPCPDSAGGWSWRGCPVRIDLDPALGDRVIARFVWSWRARPDTSPVVPPHPERPTS